MKQIHKYMQQFLAINLLIPLLLSCSAKPEKVDLEADHSDLIELTQAQYDQAGIVIGKAGRRTIGSKLKVNGIIDVPPHGKVSIHLPYGGFLKSTEMLAGTKVRKGQLLAVIENPDFIHFQQDYLENLVEGKFLKAEYERQEALFSENVIAEKEYQQAKSAIELHIEPVREIGMFMIQPSDFLKKEFMHSRVIYLSISTKQSRTMSKVFKYS